MHPGCFECTPQFMRLMGVIFAVAQRIPFYPPKSHRHQLPAVLNIQQAFMGKAMIIISDTLLGNGRCWYQRHGTAEARWFMHRWDRGKREKKGGPAGRVRYDATPDACRVKKKIKARLVTPQAWMGKKAARLVGIRLGISEANEEEKKSQSRHPPLLVVGQANVERVGHQNPTS